MADRQRGYTNITATTAIPANRTQPGTVGSPTSEVIWNYQPVDPARGPFRLVIGGATFNATFDPVMYWGYNVANGGGVALAGEPSFRDCLETHYNDGTKLTFERYWEFVDAAANPAKRPIFIQINKTTGALTAFNLRADTFTFDAWTGGATFATFSPANINMVAVTANDSQFTMDCPSSFASYFSMKYNGTAKLSFSASAGGGVIKPGIFDTCAVYVWSAKGISINVQDNSQGAVLVQPLDDSYAGVTILQHSDMQSANLLDAKDATKATTLFSFGPAGALNVPSIHPILAAGVKVGTATTDKVGFWNATPVVQPATTGTTTGFTANTSANVACNESTFTGGLGTKAYTINDIVLALKQAGILAAS